MGTAFDAAVVSPELVGIIPRAMAQIYDTIVEMKRQANEKQEAEPTFTIEAQFVEVRNYDF
jgi:hypothetical protein